MTKVISIIIEITSWLCTYYEWIHESCLMSKFIFQNYWIRRS